MIQGHWKGKKKGTVEDWRFGSSDL